MINFEPLKEHLPEQVYSELLDCCTQYLINSPERLAHFLGQCHHESAGFWVKEENLNYSLDGLLRVFPKYFNTQNVAPYVRKPIEIASRVYANRLGNSDEESLEGWYYRGRGYIQLTGKNNYKAFGGKIPDNIILHPELVASKYPLVSAAWFWSVNSINAVADKGIDQQTIADVTKKVNGGYNGLADRQTQTLKYWNILNGQIHQ